MEKLFYFLFVVVVILFQSFVESEIKVNPQLQIDFNCTSGSDPCGSKNAFCNSAGKCQCLFRYLPDGSKCKGFDCESTHLKTPITCSQLYNDPYATCYQPDGWFEKRCDCLDGFRLNFDTQKCELDDPDTIRLGDHCNFFKCGQYSKCTTALRCRCPAGSIAETEFTCTRPECSSNEFCHTNVTANTVCHHGYCQCPGPIFEEDKKTFECVRVRPDSVPLGTHCDNSTYCGVGAECTTGNEQICKCKLGFKAKSNSSCSLVNCDDDEYCHKTFSPFTTCYKKGKAYSFCKCMDGYYENQPTLECSPEAPNIGEQCAQKDDKVYELDCSYSAYCNQNQTCACREGYKARKDLPFQCEKIPLTN